MTDKLITTFIKYWKGKVRGDLGNLKLSRDNGETSDLKIYCWKLRIILAGKSYF
jgi:hypothetical protein